MDPPEEMSSRDAPNYYETPNFNRQRSIDPPEDIAGPSRSTPRFMADNQVDEFEMEGLMMTSMTNGVRRSFIGAGRNSSSSRRVSTAAIIAMCTSAWEPRNRARSSIALLFVTLLLLIMLTRNNSSAWHKVHLSEKDNKSKPQINDPLAQLTLEQRHKLLTRIYGYWGFYDGDAENRPQEPYMTVEQAGAYLDMKGDDFPEDSWQVDAVYVNHFLDAATKLVRRGQEAIFATYNGHGIVNVSVEELDGDVYGEVENPDARSAKRLDMFHLYEVDLSTVTNAKELDESSPSWQHKGGWTTSRSMDGLERRLLHAMMTNSNFTVVVTGSWQSMGYGGNHGWQSMAGVLDHLLSGVFEKLGMNLIVRAIGLPPKPGISTKEQVEVLRGGRSTLESSLGWSSIYGSDVDMVVWDDYSSISDDELDDTAKELFDFFARQALLSGPTNTPFIWGGPFEVLRNLHELADADVGQLGNAMSGIPSTTSDRIASTLPWASQYLNCPHEMQNTCQADAIRFMSQCWSDTMNSPSETQSKAIPVLPTAIGWRIHQLKGYTLGYNLLAAILDALNVWSEKTIYEGHPLADENWHIEEHVKNIQRKVLTLTQQHAPHCYKLHDKMQLPVRLCNQKLQGRTEFTPRANPSDTSLHGIVVPSPKGNTPSYELQTVFEGVAFENPVATLPSYAVDALEIIELGKHAKSQLQSTQPQSRRLNQRQLAIDAGEGWTIINSFPENDCNGSYSPTTSCGRVSTSTCLMEGHHGSIGYVSGDEATGWLSMMVPSISSGYVAVNVKIGDVKDQTASFDSLPDSFAFQYAIDESNISVLDKSQFIEKLQVFNGLGLISILDDTKKTSDKPVKISVRVVGGCPENDCRLNVSHLYWA
ncbi:hypothetical protein ACHAWO_009070 [Cyclotella atomus]|uniref:Uncharacterized protein n=1 Tax=Cyclotella atomus TaxID=382360 RepID=A0ABD3QB69_9STRA